MQARSKLNSIETMISKALIDSEISQKECTTIINKEEKYRKLKWWWKMISGWWRAKEVILRKINWLMKVKELHSRRQNNGNS